MNNYKLGSLFDGSGGFPLAGTLCGIEPVWAAEVEPYPIAVTRSRFPRMKHLGDISKVNGAEIEPVDIITFGSPCQDLSVAGKRAGLKHTDNGDGWSLAYRVLDAQYWGVPQRRRRIYLVADFRGERARQVLFEREGLRGYFTQGRTPWQRTPSDAQGSSGTDDREGEGNNCITPWDVQSRRMYTTDGAWPALYGGEGGGHGYVVTEPNGGDRGRQLDDVAYTLKIRSGCEGGGKGALVQKDKSATIATNNDQYLFQPVVYNGENITSPINKASPKPGDPCHTLGTDSRSYLVSPVICLQGNGIDRADTAGCNGKGWKEDTSYTLNTIDRPAVAYPIENPHYIVRRLTPTECARLQGFADRWGDIDVIERMSAEDYEFWKEVRNTHAAINGKKVQDYTVKQMLTWYNKLQTDSAEYKMWGNCIALPTALYVMQGITDALIDVTLLGE